LNKEVLHNILIKYLNKRVSQGGSWCDVNKRQGRRKSWLEGEEGMSEVR
jgi:hypothetical protein